MPSSPPSSPAPVPSLSLYYDPSCGYCRDVLRVLDTLELKVERRDITSEGEFRRELAAARGRTTVPVLKIEPGSPEAGAEPVWMPESLDIIRELRRLAGVPSRVPAWVDRAVGLARPVGLACVIASLLVGDPAANILLGIGIAVLVLSILRRTLAR